MYCSKGISMKKNYYLCGVLVAIATIALASCGTPQYTTEQIIDKTRIDNTVWTPELDKQDSRIKFYRQTASYMDEESGWYFQFCREGSRLDPTEYFYTFHGLNLRYRYADDNWSVRYIQDQKADGTPVFRRIKTKPGVLHFGQGGPEEKEDREVIDSILHSCPTPEELLKENPDQYEFKIVDKQLFFSLMKEALCNPPSDILTYLDWSMWAMDVEPAYTDGYKFQIGYYMDWGSVDEIYIDVLFKTGTEYNDYVQLSDLVDAGKASSEQQEAFALIQKIRYAIKSKNLFIADEETYKDKIIGDIDFYRLYVFLNSINMNTDADHYGTAESNSPYIEETISEEEFRAAGNVVVN